MNDDRDLIREVVDTERSIARHVDRYGWIAVVVAVAAVAFLVLVVWRG